MRLWLALGALLLVGCVDRYRPVLTVGHTIKGSSPEYDLRLIGVSRLEGKKSIAEYQRGDGCLIAVTYDGYFPLGTVFRCPCK